MPSSLSEKVRAALVDIRDNISSVAEFTDEGRRREERGFDKKTFYAVTRALEIISEAIRKIRMTSRPGIRTSTGAPFETPEISIATATTGSRPTSYSAPSNAICPFWRR